MTASFRHFVSFSSKMKSFGAYSSIMVCRELILIPSSERGLMIILYCLATCVQLKIITLILFLFVCSCTRYCISNIALKQPVFRMNRVHLNFNTQYCIVDTVTFELN